MRSNLLRTKSGRLNLWLAVLFIIGIVALSLIWVGETAASNTTLLVNTTDDTDDGACNAAHCSLREAINAANTLSGPDAIKFTISSTATIMLSPNTQLPIITDRLTFHGNGQTIAANEVDAAADRVFEISSTAAVIMTQLTIRDGHTASGGAGIHNLGDLTLIESTVTENVASWGDSTAGIYNGSGTLTIIRSSVIRNHADPNVGAIYNQSGIVIIENSTISDNSSSIGYGGILNGSGATLIITHSTLADNIILGSSADVLNQGTLYLRNSILAGGCVNLGSLAESINTLVWDGSCGAAFSGNAHLGPLMDYGGPTLTRSLLAGSPAIDRADPAYCPATDQRGVPRPNGAACDLGAFEGFFAPTAVSLTDFNQPPNQTNWFWPLILSPILLVGLWKLSVQIRRQ
jgi:CSLREA domain-containing protein